MLANKGKGVYNTPMDTEVQRYTGGPIICNGYLAKGTDGYLAIDAPEGFASWALARLPEPGALKHLLITHQHFDHIQDAAALQEATGCRVHAFAPYSSSLTLAGNARQWGIPLPAPFQVNDALGTGKLHADWCGLAWQLLYIPGHSTDGMAYSLPEAKCVFVGDILFSGSIGRTDFPGGSMGQLVRGIREKLLPLPPETRILSGHGPETTLQEEILNNPYLGMANG